MNSPKLTLDMMIFTQPGINRLRNMQMACEKGATMRSNLRLVCIELYFHERRTGVDPPEHDVLLWLEEGRWST